MVSFAFPRLNLLLIFGIAEIVLGVLLVLGIIKGRGTSSALARYIGGVLLIAMGIAFTQVRSMGEIVINEGSIRLKVPIQRDKVIRTEDITSVIEVNFSFDKGYRPTRKISGGNIGDVKTGWFRLANGTKAFLCIESPRCLYIETNLGFPALVGPNAFEEFETAFIEHVYAPPPPMEEREP
jgi:hypothetical protein